MALPRCRIVHVVVHFVGALINVGQVVDSVLHVEPASEGGNAAKLEKGTDEVRTVHHVHEKAGDDPLNEVNLVILQNSEDNDEVGFAIECPVRDVFEEALEAKALAVEEVHLGAYCEVEKKERDGRGGRDAEHEVGKVDKAQHVPHQSAQHIMQHTVHSICQESHSADNK